MHNNLSRFLNSFVSVATVTLLVLSGSVGAFAQIPTTTEPGVVMKGLEGKERARARLEDVVTVPQTEESGAGVSTAKVFVLKNVMLDDSAAYKAGDFQGIYNKYVGQEVSFADLNEIAREMTRKYREDGYIFSRVIVPPQKVSEGVVHFRAVEGHIASVKVVGNFKDDDGLVKKLADKIRAAGPANTKDIERYLLLIDDLPGLTARSFIKPASTAGGGDLVISVDEKAFEGSLGFDDRGSKNIGPYRFEGVGAFNSALGIHDRTTLRAIAATQLSELKFGEISHEEQIGSEGLRLLGRFAITASAPGGNVAATDIDGASKTLDVGLLYPLVRGRQTNINLLGGLNGLNSTTDLAGVRLATDRVRSVRFGGHLDFTDSLRGVNQIDLQITKGLHAFGATSDGGAVSRANGKHGFLRENLTATRIQDLWTKKLSLFLSATAQATSDPLLASEEFTVGGPSFGRAYDSGEIAGDRGYAGVAELRYGGPVDHELLQSYQVYAFVDGGRAFNIDAAGGGDVAHDSLVSTGLGARFNLVRSVSGSVEFDTPATHVVRSEGARKSRFFFNVIKRF